MTLMCANAAFLVLLMAGCGGEAELPAGPGSTVASEELVSLVDAGGIAGINDRLAVTWGGKVQFTGNSPPRQRAAQLSQNELDRLKSALAQVDIGALRSTRSDVVEPDALYHSLSYQGQMIELDYDAVPPRLDPVLRQLGTLMTQLSQ